MNNEINGSCDPDLRNAEAALRRAAARARELGVLTKTPVFVVRNGEMIDLTAEAESKQKPVFRAATMPNTNCHE
jgi:hypothetical protein